MKISKYYLLLILLFCTAQLFAQNSREIEVDVQTTKAVFLGKTKEIRHIIPADHADAVKWKQRKSEYKPPRNFRGRAGSKVTKPELEHQGPDPVRQVNVDRAGGIVVEPIVNIDGLTSGVSPNDPTGDIGLDYYVQAINITDIGVFDKNGNLVSSFAANTLWSSLGFTSRGDPIVLFDQEVNRWIMTEFPSQNQLLFAISETSDPLGSWFAYNFGTPDFPDYPKYGIWNNSYTVTTNENTASTLSVYAIDRAGILNGIDNVDIQRLTLPGSSNTEAGFHVATPVDWTGITPPAANDGPTFIKINDSSWGDVDEDQIDLYTLDIDWNDPTNTTVVNTSVVTSPFDSYPCAVDGFGFECIPQKNGDGLDGIPEVIMNQAHYRNFGSHQSMVFNFVTDATDGDNIAGIRWVELRKTETTDWSLYQEGTFAPNDSLHRFMGGIAMDGRGNIGLAYNVSGEDEYVGVRFTGRRVSDPLGQMTVEEFTAVEGENRIVGVQRGRFGDYAQMGVDPSNDRTFWYTTEYAAGGDGSSATRIVAFELSKDTIDIGPELLLNPISTDSLTNIELVELQVRNFGLDTIDGFNVGYFLEGDTAEIEFVDSLILPDSIYIHVFSKTVDFSIVDDYKLTLFTDLTTDQNRKNDTLLTVVTKLPKNDVGIVNIFGLEEDLCEQPVIIEYEVKNLGTENIDSVKIFIRENNGNPLIVDWIGSLTAGESVKLNHELTDILDGDNKIIIYSFAPNGMQDQRPHNDSLEQDYTYRFSEQTMRIELTTDEYPAETSWILKNEFGFIVARSDDYEFEDSTYVVEICLKDVFCYEFTLMDDFEDGMDGNYEIFDSEGNLLASLMNPNFGDEEINNFCLGDTCMFYAEVFVSDETASMADDGMIIIEPHDGVGPFQYSIDGGVIFQDSAVFVQLKADTYQVVVNGANDCSYSETVIVNEWSSVNTAENEQIKFIASPNPTTGKANIKVSGIQSAAVFLPIELYDLNGQLLQRIKLTNYDGIYTGPISLHAYPSGIFFIRIDSKETSQMFKLIKM